MTHQPSLSFVQLSAESLNSLSREQLIEMLLSCLLADGSQPTSTTERVPALNPQSNLLIGTLGEDVSNKVSLLSPKLRKAISRQEGF